MKKVSVTHFLKPIGGELYKYSIVETVQELISPGSDEYRDKVVSVLANNIAPNELWKNMLKFGVRFDSGMISVMA